MKNKIDKKLWAEATAEYFREAFQAAYDRERAVGGDGEAWLTEKLGGECLPENLIEDIFFDLLDSLEREYQDGLKNTNPPDPALDLRLFIRNPFGPWPRGTFDPITEDQIFE